MNAESTGLLADIEQAIVDKLRPLLPSFTVEAYPDDPEKYNLLHNKGAVLVAYKGRRRNPESDAFCGYKESICYFNTYILSRHLRAKDAHQGVYDPLLIISDALDGWQPEDLEQCDVFEFAQDAFVSKGENVFIYNGLYQITVRGI